MMQIVGAAASIYAVYLGGSERIADSQETNMARYFRYLSNFNTGFMRSLQSNPNDTNTQCMDRTKATNLKIVELGDPKSYQAGEVRESEFIEKF